jgi:NitT/TauT family transport system ATP-binding protein
VVSAALNLDPLPLAPTLAAPAFQRPEIALRDVTVAYGKGLGRRRVVLSGINIDIAAGEFVVILGETGCGKSTLLRLILGQEFPETGAVEVDSKPVRRIDSRCGYVPQKYSLFPDRTVLGNVMYGPENAYCGMGKRLRPSYFRFRNALRCEAKSYLKRMGLREQDLQKYPHQLSGGMQQRVAIAQALMMRPPVLLMDEAFSALDPSTRSNLQGQMHDLWLESRPTVVFVTHNTQEALLMGTRIILLARHQDNELQSNVRLDMQLPTARLPFARRLLSPEFNDLHDYVKDVAQRFSSMNRDEEPAPITVEGNRQ